MTMLSWGTSGTADARLGVTAAGLIVSNNAADATSAGPFVADGAWHSAMVVEDNAATDTVKRKLYVDGRLVASSQVMNTVTLAGANRFRIGSEPGGAQVFGGMIDAPFVIPVALTPEQVHAVHNVGVLQALAPSPRSEGEHIEALEATRILATFDTLEGCDQIDLRVAA